MFQPVRLCHATQFKLNLKFEFLPERGASIWVIPLAAELEDGYEQKQKSG
jgi:hypothetical protein